LDLDEPVVAGRVVVAGKVVVAGRVVVDRNFADRRPGDGQYSMMLARVPLELLTCCGCCGGPPYTPCWEEW